MPVKPSPSHDDAARELDRRLVHVIPYGKPSEREAVLTGALEWFATTGGGTELGRRVAFAVDFAEWFGRDQDRLVLMVPDPELLAVRFDPAAARDPGEPVVHVRLAGGEVRYLPWPCPAQGRVRMLVEGAYGPESPVRVSRCVNRGPIAWADGPGPVVAGSGAHEALGRLLALDGVLGEVGVGVRDVVTSGAAVDVLDCGPRTPAPWRVDGNTWVPDRAHPSWPAVSRGYESGAAALREFTASGGLATALNRFSAW